MTIDQNHLSGSVERITYYNAENGYAVIRVAPDTRRMLPYAWSSGRGGDLATVVGHLPELQPGEWVKLAGEWQRHREHGWQFVAQQCEQGRPATVEGIRRYLGSGLVRGVGKVMAERIVAQFGAGTLDIIDSEPEQLRRVLGIGPKRIGRITKAWEEQRAIREVMLFLQTHGVTTGLAVKIYRHYREQALEVVTKTPYRLVQDVHGIGFKTADKIAQALGLAHDDPARIEAGVAYTLNRMAEEGHVYVPQEELEPKSAEILTVPQPAVSAVITHLEQSELLRRDTLRYPMAGEGEGGGKSAETPTVREEQAVYLTPLYHSEIGVTRRIRQLLAHPVSRVRVAFDNRSAPRLLADREQRAGLELAVQQRTAILTALTHKVTVLTGGPGTGKTTTLRTLLDVLDDLGRTYVLASPTGRAAKRLTEATDRPAKTLHRLLEYQPGSGFGRNEDNLLDADMVIVDEASMLDLVLANTLLKAIGADSHLLLVGDIDQLPSVGAGDVLRDLIASGVVPVVRLEVVFRQSADSLIITNAHRINQGRMPLTPPDARDFFLFVKEQATEAADLLVDVVQNRIPRRFGLDPLAEIQVLSPMYNGALGVALLNEQLQQALNPPRSQVAERRHAGRLFRVGDRVMQTVNNYDKGVFNGDIGRITSLDPVEQTLTLNMDGTPVLYDFLELDELAHAWAISVHKSQGSEYPCVVIPVHTTHFMMLQRNLLYTAITRARKLVVLVGTRKALAIAVKNNRTTKRHTALDLRLR
jgi:exodeoxyribonuclease V alpha subunit